MKLLTACCVAALFASITGYAQTTTGSTRVGTMTVTATVAPATQSGSSVTKPGNVSNELTVWRTSQGQIEYSMSAAGARVVQTDGSIDQATTGEIFNALAAEAVRQGVAKGYTSGSGTVQTAVWSEREIDRFGSGIDTRFDPSNSETSLKQIFTISNGGTNVQYVGTQTTTSGDAQSVMQ